LPPFEFFESDIGMLQLMKDKFLSVGLRNIPRMVGLLAKYMPDMNRGRNECFTDLNQYLDGIEETGRLTLAEQDSPVVESYPNSALWGELTGYAWEKWGVTLGFTELLSQLIFRGKAVLFRYALVCIQEMDQEKVDLAPGLDTGEEVQRVYVSLGLAVNDIARWLRLNHGVNCQSNHPLAGLVNTTGGKGGDGLVRPEWIVNHPAVWSASADCPNLKQEVSSFDRFVKYGKMKGWAPKVPMYRMV